MTTLFENEKRLQKAFNLRHRPERFVNKDNAIRFANGCIKLHVVFYLDENPANFIPGYYVVCFADANRLETEAEGIFTYIG
jgi:hypothetical protein